METWKKCFFPDNWLKGHFDCSDVAEKQNELKTEIYSKIIEIEMGWSQSKKNRWQVG